jgi:hypothetical protein
MTDATERPAEATAQGEAHGGAEGRASVCPKCGTASCLDDASLDFDWNVVTDDPAPVVRTLNTIDPNELARLRKAEAERDGLRGKVEAVRALHRPREYGGRPSEFCNHDDEVLPCPTLLALDGGDA